jgi:hypothetical protein
MTWCAAPTAASISPTPGCAFRQSFGGPDFRTLYLTPPGAPMKLQFKTPGFGAFRYGSYAPKFGLGDSEGKLVNIRA